MVRINVSLVMSIILEYVLIVKQVRLNEVYNTVEVAAHHPLGKSFDILGNFVETNRTTCRFYFFQQWQYICAFHSVHVHFVVYIYYSHLHVHVVTVTILSFFS